MKWLKAVRAGSKSKSFEVRNFSELTSEERTRYSCCFKFVCVGSLFVSCTVAVTLKRLLTRKWPNKMTNGVRFSG